MQAEIIAIGDEILIGQTVDTNSSFIAHELNALGISVVQKRVIADTAEAITEALDTLKPSTRIIFMTGGLGPTKDDLTKRTLLNYFGGELEFHDEVYQHIETLFGSFNRKPKPIQREQAMLPNSCTPLLNAVGTAPGMRFERAGRFYFSLPGVPYETEEIVKEHILPWIAQEFSGGQLYHRTVLTQGIPESELAEKLSDWEDSLPNKLKLAYLPSPGLVRLRLTGLGLTAQESKELVERELVTLREILGEVIYGEDLDSLEAVVGHSLSVRGLTLCTAESCTGGYIGHLITAVAGSSAYYQGGVVTYSNALKQKLLGVENEILASHGAVSEATVLAMAKGARKRMNCDFAIATSGIAGPDGGTESKPVGTVWIGIAGPQRSIARTYRFGNHRGRNIRRSALMALDLLRKEVQKIEN